MLCALDGTLQVSTSTSLYVIDFRAAELIRVPGTAGGQQGFAVAALRRDYEPIRLISLDELQVGASMVLTLDGLAPIGPTIRTTTPVTAIPWAQPPASPVAADLAIALAGSLLKALQPALDHTEAWLTGRVRETPHHARPPLTETIPLLPVLRHAVSIGLLPTRSQPGMRNPELTQRVFLDLIVTPERVHSVTSAFAQAGLLVDAWPISPVPTCCVACPVTWQHEQELTRCLMPGPGPTDPELLAAWQSHFANAFPQHFPVRERCYAVVVIDPQPGPSQRLWDVLGGLS